MRRAEAEPKVVTPEDIIEDFRRVLKVSKEFDERMARKTDTQQRVWKLLESGFVEDATSSIDIPDRLLARVSLAALEAFLADADYHRHSDDPSREPDFKFGGTAVTITARSPEARAIKVMGYDVKAGDNDYVEKDTLQVISGVIKPHQNRINHGLLEIGRAEDVDHPPYSYSFVVVELLDDEDQPQVDLEVTS